VAGISGQQLVQFALQFLGTPYRWGGTQPGGFDCSGLMQYVYGHFGLSIPRVTFDQIHAGRQVQNIQSAQAGDLIFFDSDHNGTPAHVGMYMGNGQIVVADHTGTPVRVRSLNQEDKVLGITRMSGVVATNSNYGPGDYASLLGLTSMSGHSGSAAIPAARPTFDWWSGMGVSSGNLNDANQNVGLIKAFIQNDPELGNLYSKAVANSWSQDMFISQLHATNWWRTQSDTVRKNLAMKSTDPATWNQTVTNEKSKVQELATKLGVPLTGNSLQNVTNTAALFGYNDAQIQNMLSAYLVDIKNGWFGGYAGQVQLAIKEYAMDQGIPVSSDYVNRNVQSIVAGTSSLNATRALIATQAAAAFPMYADQINKGVTVGEIAKPYASALSQILEQNPDHVDLYNPLLRSAMQFKDPKTQEPAVKQLYDYEIDLRKNPAWLNTNNAREGLMAGAQKVLTDLGLTAPDLGAAPEHSPNSATNISASVAKQSIGLSGISGSNLPTLQGKEAMANPTSPTATNTSAASLSPSTSFSSQGTKQFGG